MAWDPAADRQTLAEVIRLGLLWHCLCAITRLEVPERLAAGPLPIPQLAAARRRRPGRALAGAAAGRRPPHRDLEGDRVGLTHRGRLLCPDHLSSLAAVYLASDGRATPPPCARSAAFGR